MRVKANHTAKLIKHRLKILNMNQSELSRKLGWTNNNSQYVSNIVTGKCPFPPKSVSILAKSIQVDPSIIVDAMAMDYCEALNQEIIKQLEVK